MKPTLNDPKEYALIKKIYFPPDLQDLEVQDQEEIWDRMIRKHLTNQAR